MANRDHSLDDGIIQAAYSEFLAYGFQKASLHKIAEKAGVTTGAIYTRYKNKDALFASLLQDFFETMQVLFAPIAEEYEKAKCSAQPDDILRAINAEEQVYFQLLTEHCNDCTLFFCRSDGSSMETVLHKLMDQKAEQTVEFFSHIYGKAPNADAIRLLMGSQFWYFRQLLDQHMEEGRMLTCLQAVLRKAECLPAYRQSLISPTLAGGSYAIPCNKSEKLIRTVHPSVSYGCWLETAN